VPNAAALVARLAAALHDRHSRVAIPGFYDRVRDLPPLERASLDQVPFDEEAFRAHAGVAFLDGEEGRTSLERIWTRPTAEVVGVHAGYPGPGVKTIVPARAELRLALRLVPDQDPEEVGRLLSTWVGSQLPPGVDHVVRITGGVRPVLTPVDHPAVAGLCRAMERVWGAKPLFTREGGSGPEEALSRLLQAPVLFLGVSLPGDRWHGPDERLVLSQFWRGLLAAGELLIELETCR
jgi:acetylornithine deacetylase/succinyl-diaminopimelate desuccinylase-like protein